MNTLSKCTLCIDPEEPDNLIFTCKSCALSVHGLCYGIPAPTEQNDWVCSPCKLGSIDSAVCELCVQPNGALKRTSCGKWVHVICALFTDGSKFEDFDQMEPINISNISQSKWNQTCAFCLKSVGWSPLCSQPKCPVRIHISCAQKENCLREITNKKDNSLKFRAYCIEHKPEDSKRRLSGKFVQGLLAKKSQKELKQVKSVSSEANCAWIMGKVNEQPFEVTMSHAHNSKGADSGADVEAERSKLIGKCTKKTHSENAADINASNDDSELAPAKKKFKKSKHHSKNDQSSEHLDQSVLIVAAESEMNKEKKNTESCKPKAENATIKKKKKKSKHHSKTNRCSQSFEKIYTIAATEKSKKRNAVASDFEVMQVAECGPNNSESENRLKTHDRKEIKNQLKGDEERRPEDYLWWDAHDVFAGRNKENFIENRHGCYKDKEIILLEQTKSALKEKNRDLKVKMSQLQEMNSNLQLQLWNTSKRSENDGVSKASPEVLKNLAARIVPQISDDETEVKYPNGVKVKAKLLRQLISISSDPGSDRMYVNSQFFVFFSEKYIKKQIRKGLNRAEILAHFRDSNRYEIMKSIYDYRVMVNGRGDIGARMGLFKLSFRTKLNNWWNSFAPKVTEAPYIPT